MKTILVIDDEAPMLVTLSAILRSGGYEVATASSGEAGLRLAYERLPDLILCDINMPDLDGTTVLQALREDPATADRQIVLMTGADREMDKAREMMDMGADDFLKKPFSPEVLLKCIEARLRRNDLNRHVATRTYDHLRHTMHSTLPHELFSPIASILGITELVRDRSQLPREELIEMVDDIDRHARKLHRSFDNYLKLMELETMSYRKPTRPTTAARVWQTIESTARATTQVKDRVNDLRIDGLPHELPLSEHDLATVIEELVDNACTYSRKGTPITVTFTKDNEFVQLDVRDEGRGMTEAQIQGVKAMAHPDQSTRKNQPMGEGIGLLVIQKIVEVHGGGMRLASQPGEGTRITALWPLSKIGT